MRPAHSGHGFLAEPPLTPGVQALFDDDIAELGYVMNLSRVGAQSPAANTALFGLLGDMVELAGLTFRQRGVLVSATASTIGDAYSSLAWGTRLSTEAGDGVAEAVLRGDDDGLDAVDAALAHWARLVARDPNATTAADLEPLRAVGFDDRQIFALTVFVALREDAPASVDAAVSYGRPAAAEPS